MTETQPDVTSLPQQGAPTPATRRAADGLSLASTLFAALCVLAAFGATALVRSALVHLDAYSGVWEIPLVATIAVAAVLFWPALRAMNLSRKARRFRDAGDHVHARIDTAAAKESAVLTFGWGVFLLIAIGSVCFVLLNNAEVGKTFFFLPLMLEKWPLVVKAFTNNIFIFVVAEILVLIWGLVVAILRLLPGPAERMIIVAARQIARRVREKGYPVVLAGVGHAFFAARLAKLWLAAEGHPLEIIVETGLLDVECGPTAHGFLLAHDNVAQAKRLSSVEEALGVLTCGADSACLGVIGAAQVDARGNVNSTHILGRSMMNGIGGSADFARNAFLSMFICPSVTKGGKISTIVPLVSHLDSSEHSVNVIATEHGVADLRGKSPHERAEALIERCAHPDYRGILRDYLALGGAAHTPHNLAAAFDMHLKFARDGDMRGVEWNRR